MAKGDATPLDAERTRLREAGYTDDEISKYFVERLRGASQPSTAAGGAPVQGTMTGVLGNASAVLSHARGTIPSIQRDLANVRSSSASPKSRAKSAGTLALVAAIVAVLGFAIYQEWQQHIVSATATAAAQVQKLQAEAAAAKTLNDAQAEKLRAEADVAKQINEAQLRKTLAEECSARMKAAIDTVPMNRLFEAGDIISRDCDPTYAARTKECDADFKSLLSTIETLDPKDPNPTATITAKVVSFKEKCNWSAEQRDASVAAMEHRQQKIDTIKKAIADLAAMQQKQPNAPDSTLSPTPTPTPAPKDGVDPRLAKQLDEFMTPTPTPRPKDDVDPRLRKQSHWPGW